MAAHATKPRSLLGRCEQERDAALAEARRLRRELRDLRQWQESTRRYLNQILDDQGVQAALDALTRKLNAETVEAWRAQG